MKGKVFILEDDTSICGLIKVALEMNGLSFRVFSTVRGFTDGISEERPDVALIDIMLPDGSGLDLLREQKALRPELPVILLTANDLELDALQFVKSRNPEVACIILSALSKEEDKVNGLNLGADDYVSKPFSVLELTARVNARLREKQKPALMAAGNVTLNTETFSCTVGGEAVALNRKEYELLRVLMENKGKVLSRDRLLTDVWGYDAGETRTLDNHVARLRKLGIKIETVFGVGYKLAAD